VTASLLPRGTAIFSACDRYRYRLTRHLGTQAPLCTFIMLNPSTATAEEDDPTIRRCIGFARAMGCGRLVVANIFAWRATKPGDMKAAADPIGPENDAHIERLARKTAETGGKLICAWGTHGGFMDRDRAVMAMLETLPVELMSLGETDARFPRHPLYLRNDCRPMPYRGRVAKAVEKFQRENPK
jgi:hypothetical protein